MNNQIMAQARQIYQQALPDIFKRRNVVACGLGYKISAGKPTGDLSLIISVTHKVPSTQLAPEDLIPKSIQGILTDVVETGRIRAQMPENPTGRFRPAQPGISIGHHDITAGTFGLLVHRNGVPFILSNNHVLADCNAGHIGDAIYQPGPADGGTAADRIAALAEFETLDFGDNPSQCSIADAVAGWLNFLARVSGSSHRLQPIQQTAGINAMDAALAQPDTPDLVIPSILQIGLPTGVGSIELGQEVQKMGRTTGLTHGYVTQVNVTVSVDYNGRTARFTEQVLTGNMSNPGDSGSAILDTERRVAGLLFAGSTSVTIFTPIQRVLDHFGVQVMTG
ncbi:MAG TPA: hypothetical protein PLH19_09340 [Anaerolineae bacterium]|nr:hypothetical protein [Anaerolineae bacterium]HQH38721.1 hypothetical protein [Anaerolineae bacterium]